MIALTSPSSPVLAVSGFFGCTLACISIVLPGYVKPLGVLNVALWASSFAFLTASTVTGTPGLEQLSQSVGNQGSTCSDHHDPGKT